MSLFYLIDWIIPDTEIDARTFRLPTLQAGLFILSGILLSELFWIFSMKGEIVAIYYNGNVTCMCCDVAGSVGSIDYEI